jgi:WD40 repeat protein
VLKGHKATVRGVGIIADGRRAITACEDNMTRVWNLETCAGLTLRDELKEPVLSVNMTPDGRRAVSTDGGMPANEMEPGIGYWNHTLRVLDLDSGVCSRVLEQHVKHRDRITMTPDSRLAISIREDGILRVWDLETGACLYTLKGDLDFVRSMSVTPDGRRAIFANRDHALHVWDLKAGTCLHIMKGHNHFVSCVSMTPDGRRAISVDNNMTCIWDLDKGKCLRARKRHNSACMTPDGRRAISAGSDKKLRVWDMETGASVNVIKGHTASVTSFWMAPDSRRAVLQSSTMSSDHRTVSDYTLRVFDLEAGVCLHVLKGHTASVTGVWVSPDSRRAVSASHDRTLRVWDLDSGVCLHMLKGHSRMIEDLWMKADGQSAVTMGFDSLRVWNLETGACLAVERVPAPVSCFDSSSVLDRVIIGASTGEVLRYDVLGIADTAVSQIP